jgi:hypothetical protein
MSAPPPEHPVDLTPEHRDALRAVRDYCDTPPTLRTLYLQNLKSFALTLFFTVTWVLIAARLLGSVEAACVIGGIGIGVALREVVHLHQYMRSWQLTLPIIDRRKLEELVGEPAEKQTTEYP